MGLFDDVRCEYRLPNPAHQSLVFQTKDLENLMDEYVITRRGRLVRTKRGLLAPRPCRVVCSIHQDLRICGSVEVGPEEHEWIRVHLPLHRGARDPCASEPGPGTLQGEEVGPGTGAEARPASGRFGRRRDGGPSAAGTRPAKTDG